MLVAMFVVSFLFEILLPFAIGFFLWKKFGAKWKIFFLGVLSFFISQVIHIPMAFGYQALFRNVFDATVMTTGLHLINAVALGLMAGVCEEVVRWFAFKLAKDEGNSSRSALMLGAGHGGLESVLVGVSVLGSTVVLVLLQSGVFPVDELLPEQFMQLQALLNAPWYSPLLGAFERLAAVTLHISLAMIVWLGIRDHKVGYLFLAILWHAFVDCIAVFALQGLGWSTVAVEALMLVIALISAGIIYLIVKKKGLLTLYAPEKLDDEEEFIGLFAEQFRDAGFAALDKEGDDAASDTLDSPENEE